MPVAPDSLPYVDEHAAEIAASAGSAWDSLLVVAERSFGSDGTSRFARLLGCEDLRASGPRPLATGSTIPGFHVAVADPPRELALAGRHRFSGYALVFRVEEAEAGRSRLRAETRAEFPHLKGAVYKTLVIRTRMHVLVTRRILAAVKSRAERT
jgi:hypothetical protein